IVPGVALMVVLAGAVVLSPTHGSSCATCAAAGIDQRVSTTMTAVVRPSLCRCCTVLHKTGALGRRGPEMARPDQPRRRGALWGSVGRQIATSNSNQDNTRLTKWSRIGVAA